MTVQAPPFTTPPIELIVLTDIVPMVIIAVAGLTGFSLLLRAWSRRGLNRADAEHIRAGLEMLHGSIEDLRAEQEALANDVRDRMTELSGRVEFAERLLARGTDDERLP